MQVSYFLHVGNGHNVDDWVWHYIVNNKVKDCTKGATVWLKDIATTVVWL